MLKAEQVDFEIRLWPLLKGDLVLPSLVLRKPEIVIEKGDKDRLNWELGEAPAAAAAAKEAVEPDNRFETPLIGRLEVTDGKLSYRDPKRKLDLDGTVSTATGQAGDQPQAELQLKGKLEGQPLTAALRRRLDRHAARHRAALSARPRRHLRRHQAQGQGHGDGSLPVDRRRRPALAVGPRPRRHLSAARHPRPADSALQHQRQAASRVRRLEIRPEQVACRRQRPHRRRAGRHAAQARASHGQARLAEAGLRRPGAAGRRAARQARRQRLAPAAPDPAAARGHGRSLPQRAAQGREAAGDEHGRHARRQAGDRARLPAGAGACPSASWCRTAWRRPSRSP